MSSVMERRESSLIQESRGCPSRRPNGYWKVWENVEAEILSVRIPEKSIVEGIKIAPPWASHVFHLPPSS